MDLRNKKILITAGPTWVPIDAVRIIGNTATGETGILLAEQLRQKGAKVTLLLGLPEPGYINKNIRLIRFRFFEELKDLISRELKNRRYDSLIHCAAVSDYKVASGFKKKIRSGIKQLKLILTPTPKIIDSLKKNKPSLFLVGFKFEPQSSRTELVAKALKLIYRSRADLIVANTCRQGHYNAYLVTKKDVSGLINSKPVLVRALAEKIENALCLKSGY